MFDKDKKEFVQHLLLACDYYGLKDDQKNKILKQESLILFFNLMKDYSIDEFIFAMNQHLKKSQFMPKASDLIKNIEGDQITNEKIIGSARLPVDALGCLARLHIGQHDLDHMNSFQLNERAEEFKQLIPEIKQRLRSGKIKSKEAAIMKSFEVNPSSGFVVGSAPLLIPDFNEKANYKIEQVKKRTKAIEQKLLISSPDCSSVTKKDIETMKNQGII